MTKKLEMVFTSSLGKTVTLSLADPKEALTKAEVETVMNQMIAKNAFVSKAGALAAIKETNIATSDSVALA